MDAKLEVSVLLPVRDGGTYLGAALASLSRQTLRSFEVVIADDGSRDATAEVAGDWVRRDPRFRLLRLPRRGIAPALAAALDEARAPLIARQDADDVSHPDRLRRLLLHLGEHPETDVAGSRVLGFPRREVTEGMRRYESWQNGLLDAEAMRRERFVECPLAHASAAIRRGALAAAGGWRDSPWPEDLDLWLRLFRTGARFGKLPEVLYFWRERPDRTTRTDVRLSLAAFRRCKIHHLGRDLLGPPPGPVALWSAGRLGRGWRRDLEAAGYRVRFDEVDPRRPSSAPDLPPSGPLLIALGVPRYRDRWRAALSAGGRTEERDHLFIY